MKHLHYIYTALFCVAAILFFGLAYPHHLHYQEQFQLFLFDSDYVWEMIKVPGGLADLLGRFCTQFFLFAWVGAVITGLLLSAVQLLTLRLARLQAGGAAGLAEGWLYGLSFVPSFLLWLFLLDENALLGGCWAVTIALLASWAYQRSTFNVQRTTLIATAPLLYWMVGPVCVVFFLFQLLHYPRSAWSFGVFVLLALMPLVLSHLLPMPADRLWFGIHYYRYPTEVPSLLWAAASSVLILPLAVRLCGKRLGKSVRSALPLRSAKNSQLSTVNYQLSTINFQLSTLLTFAVMGSLVWQNANFKAERVMAYDFMARFCQWNRILVTIDTDRPNNQVGVTVQNLALAMHGELTDRLFYYNQNGTAGLLPDFKSDSFSPLATAEVFYQIGIINAAQRWVFDAQEAILDYQKSGRCYKRLAETSLINGDYVVTRKYLQALQKTLFYRKWANETLPLLGDEAAIARHPEYGRLRQWTYKDDFLFTGHVTSELLERLLDSNPDNLLAREYLAAYYLLTRKHP